MFKIFIRIAVLLALVAGISACEVRDPEPDANAQCRHIDFAGDPVRPDSVTITCDDGDTIVIPGPIEQGPSKLPTIVSVQGEVVETESLYIPSKSGLHYVWYYVMIDGEFRAYHDDQSDRRSKSGKETISKVIKKNLTDPNAIAVYQAW